MRITGARQVLFPYLMQKNADGSWTFINRHYKPVGLITDRYASHDDPENKVFLRPMTVSTMRKLSIDKNEEKITKATSAIYLYDDDSAPERSEKNMRAYLEKLSILMKH